MSRYIIFSDLDGTLLDHHSYSFEAAKPALQLIAEKEIPLILASSKTLAEIQHIQKSLEISHPFIVENGGAICIPAGYFKIENTLPIIDNFQIRFFGPAYEDILKTLQDIRRTYKFLFKGFNDMTIEEVMRLTGLPYNDAQNAKSRLCSEPIIWENSLEKLEDFKDALIGYGLKSLRGGRFYHLMGNSDKGKAIGHMMNLYNGKYPQDNFVTIGIGDSPNDIEMLKAVNTPILVQRPDGSYIDIPFKNKVIFADGIGPEGWNEAIIRILSTN